jgi:hypothetical protein
MQEWVEPQQHGRDNFIETHVRGVLIPSNKDCVLTITGERTISNGESALERKLYLSVEDEGKQSLLPVKYDTDFITAFEEFLSGKRQPEGSDLFELAPVPMMDKFGPVPNLGLDFSGEMDRNFWSEQKFCITVGSYTGTFGFSIKSG